MYSLFLSVGHDAFRFVVVEYICIYMYMYVHIRHLEVSSVHNKSHTCGLVFGCGLKRDLVVVVCAVGLVFLFFVAPFSLLAVFCSFSTATSFNQNVSNWNTGAVTSMYQSKCTRSLPLWATAFRLLFF